MSKQMVISVMSKDRPGIIADVTGAIYRLEGDLADLNQSVLWGYLTMILIATFANEVTPEDVIAEVSHIKTPVKFEVSIKEIDEPLAGTQTSPPEESYIMTVHGKNQSGLVYRVSQFCYDHTINIFDLATTLRNDQYTMVLQLDLGRIASLADFRRDLEQFASDTGLKVTLQHNVIFQATNDVHLH